MCRTKPRFLHLFLLILLSIGFFACNQPTEQLLPELEGIEVDIESLMDAYDIEDFSMQGMLLILYHDDGTTEKIPITPNMIRQVDLELLSSPGTHEITITHGNFTTTFTLTMVYTGLTEQLRLIYHQGVESGLITGTYEAWLDSIKGADGVSITAAIINENGHLILTFSNDEVIDVGRVVGNDGIDGLPIILKVEDGYIKWSYEGETTWTNLLALTELIGLTGDDGVGIESIDINLSYELIITFTDDEVINLGNIRGEQGLPGLDGSDGLDGKQVLFQVHSGYIQWQYIDDEIWNDLIEIATLIGPKGDKGDTGDQGLPGSDGIDGKEVIMQVSGGYIQWKYVDDVTWNNLIELSSLIGPQGIQGDTGDQGLPGSDGIDGKEVIMQVSGGYIQWKYIDDVTWNNLIELSSLIGPQGLKGDTGEQGLPGSDGIDGKEVNFQVSEGYIQWQYIGDNIWHNLIQIETLTGIQGVGIANTSINQYGELIITYTDDTFVNIGQIYIVYTVNFIGLDGYLIDSQIVTYGSDAIEPIVPSTIGYTFTGWSTAFTNIQSNVAITAIYTLNTYALTFDSNGGTPINPLLDVEYGSYINLSIPEKEGYTFLGWYLGNSVNDLQFTNATKVTENTLLYARWEEEVFLVMFVDVNDKVLKAVEVTFGESTTPPEAPEIIGYQWIGWTKPYTNITQNTVIKTLYEVNQYSIDYYIRGDNQPIALYPEEIIISVSLGESHSIALTSFGRVFTWGGNSRGQLGDGTTINRFVPVDITHRFNLENDEIIMSVSLGNSHSAALTSLGNLFTWGDNFYGQLGTGIINYYAISKPIKITTQFNLVADEKIVHISLGDSHSSALTSIGRVFTWGSNWHGQLGDGTTTEKANPTEITNRFDLEVYEIIVNISLGNRRSSAVTSLGRIFTWGYNISGSLGDGTTIQRTIPTEITNRFDLAIGEIVIGTSLGVHHSSAITSSGRMFTWGYNATGALGDGTYIGSSNSLPINITHQFNLEIEEKIVSTSLGTYYSSAITSSGRMFTWGYNDHGQLGDGTTNTSSIPIDITIQFNLEAEESIVNASLGVNHSSAITSLGKIYTWGNNNFGKLGNGTNDNILYAIPSQIQISQPSLILSEAFDYKTSIIAYTPIREGYIINDWISLDTFKPYVFNTMPAENIKLTSHWTAIEYLITYHLDGGINHHSNPTQYTIETDGFQIKDPSKDGHTFLGWYDNAELTEDALTYIPQGSTGEIALYAKWQINEYDMTYYIYEDYDSMASLPLYQGETITTVSLGNRHSAALTSTGRIFTWGLNNQGQLGDGTATNRFLPIDITHQFHLKTNETVISVSLGGDYSSALTSAGRIFTWGSNSHGQLGDGTITNAPTPIDVTGQFELTVDETIVSVSLGFSHSSALTSAGRIFTWGSNWYGQLGDGTTSSRSTPIDVTSQFELTVDETIVSVSLGSQYSSALTSAGRMFTWGYNDYGQLGNGTSDYDAHPVPENITSQFELAVDETIISVSLRGNHSSAITSSGRMFTWGYNDYGQLGNGTSDYEAHSVPENITSQFNLEIGETIISVSLGGNHSSAITSSGRMFTWGFNLGQLGDGTTVHRFVPTEITSHFNLEVGEMIVMVSLGAVHSSAISSHGRIFTWGRSNAFGELGDGSTTSKIIPTELKVQYLNMVHTETNVYGAPISEYVPIREHYTMSNWISLSSGSSFIFDTMPGENIVLYGRWIPNIFIIDYYLDGGINHHYNPDYYTIESDTIELLEPTKVGHSFLSWHDNEALTGAPITTIPQGTTGDITLYAKWQINSYDVKYGIYEDYDPTVFIPLYEGESIVSISLGYSHSAALTSQGRLFNWGRNAYGQLGDGTNIQKTTPVEITSRFNLSADETITSVFLDSNNSSAITSSGRLFVWGENWYGELGDGTSTHKYSPTEITNQFHLEADETILYVAFGSLHSAALTSQGRLFTWGRNNVGQLGDGSLTGKLLPVDITSRFNLEISETITGMSLGYQHSSAITSFGRIFTWGSNLEGQLGDGTTIYKNVPTVITSQFNLNTSETIVSVSVDSSHSAALTSSGRLFTWGQNGYGQLGDGTATRKLVPTNITSQFNLATEDVIKSVSLGSTHSSAVTLLGRVFTWGRNHYGQIGDGTTSTRYIPREITSQFNLEAEESINNVVLGGSTSFGLTTSNRMFIWGDNSSGQLGDGTTTLSNKPKEIKTQQFYLLHTETYVYDSILVEYTYNKEGYQFSGWMHRGTTYTFGNMPGYNIELYGYFVPIEYTITYHLDGGINSINNPSTYTTESDTIHLEDPIKEGYSFLGWYADETFTGEIITTIPKATIGDITLYAKWQIGHYDINYYIYDDHDPSVSIVLYPGETIVNVSAGYGHSAVLTSKGRVFTWGQNTSGQLGDGTNTQHDLPIEITNQFNLELNETITSLSLGYYHSSVITSFGRVFTWGSNGHGQLGDGTTIERHTPLDITNHFNLEPGETIIRITLGVSNSSAITSLGRIFTWGNNLSGQLGDGTTTHKYMPQDVTEYFYLETGEIIASVSLGYYHSAAITSSGRIFTWGYNISGQLGDGTTTSRILPTEITNEFILEVGEVISAVSLGYYHSSAITSFGRLFTWGSNNFGQLGDGTTTHQHKPLDITVYFNLETDETITYLSSGDYHVSAMTSLSHVFTWGRNTYGQLGDGTTTNKHTPLDTTAYFNLETDETIIGMSLGALYSTGLTSNGRIYTWGRNDFGQLGDGTETNKSNPTEVQKQYLYLAYSETYVYGSLVTEYIHEEAGYILSGWYLDRDMTTLYNFGIMAAKNIMLYAKRDAIIYDITYHLDGGINSTNNPATYTVADTVLLEHPTKEGYSFLGWFSHEELTGDAIGTIQQGSTGNITMYAKWEINTYDMNYYTYEDYNPLAEIILYPGETIESLSLGSSHSAALTSIGRLYTWGYNNNGQLGDGTTTQRTTPIEITDRFNLCAEENIVNITMGSGHTIVLTSIGRVFIWGSNNRGQLGVGTTENQLNPIEITHNFSLSLGEVIISVSAREYRSSAITSSGRMFTWGYNNYGQLGDGTTANKYTPVEITSQFGLEVGETISTVTFGYYHSAAITSAGRVFTWGRNDWGQLGDGLTTQRNSPIDITTHFNLGVGETIVDISLGFGHSSGITSSGRVFTWGGNSYGQLGDETTVNKNTPTEITTNFNLEVGETIVSISLGGGHSSALSSTGRMFTWGYNYFGQLGIGTIDLNVNSTPIDITNRFILEASETITSIIISDDYSSALTSLCRLFTWGNNSYGKLGDGTTTNRSTPIEVFTQHLNLAHSETYVYGSSVTEYLPTREGYYFSGWYVDMKMTTTYTFAIMPADDVKLYGYWIPNA